MKLRIIYHHGQYWPQAKKFIAWLYFYEYTAPDFGRWLVKRKVSFDDLEKATVFIESNTIKVVWPKEENQ